MKNKKLKTKSDWLKYYEERTGTQDLKLDESEFVLFHPEHGFITFFTHENVFELHHMVGDGKYWQEVIMKIMHLEGLTKVRAFTKRNPKAWIRKYGGHIRGYYMEANLDELKN